MQSGRGLGRFVAAAAISGYGDWLTTVAIVVALLRITGWTGAPAAYLLVRVVARLVGSAAAGTIAARIGAIRLTFVCTALGAPLCLLLIPLLHAGSAAAVLAVVGMAHVVGGMARAVSIAVIPALAGEGRLGRANTQFALGTYSSIVIAPAISVPLLAWIGTDGLIVVDAITFGIGAVLIAGIQATSVGRRASTGRVGLGGLAVLNDLPLVRLVSIATGLEAAAVTAASASLALIAADRLGDPGRVGILYACVGIGEAIAGIPFLRRRPPASSGAIVGWDAIALTSLGVIPFVPGFFVGLPLSANGASQTVYTIAAATLVQDQAAGERLPRVSAALETVRNLGVLVGAIVTVVLVPFIGWQPVLAGTSLVGFVGLLLAQRWQPPATRVVGARDVAPDAAAPPGVRS